MRSNLRQGLWCERFLSALRPAYARSVLFIVFATFALSGCTFIGNEKVRYDDYFDGSKGVNDGRMICVVSPDATDAFSTAARQLRSAAAKSDVKAISKCNLWLSSAYLIFSKEETNLVFDISSCKISRPLTLVGSSGEMVEGGPPRCGMKADFRVIEITGAGFSQYRIIQRGREAE